MLRSAGARFLIVGLLALLMSIPLLMAALVIDSRADLQRQAASEIGREWGGQQHILGPQIAIPVEGPVTRRVAVSVTGDEESADARQEFRDVTETLRKGDVYLYPERFEADIEMASDVRSRGIFDVPVYTATAALSSRFDAEAVESALEPEERALWEEARLILPLGTNRSLRGETVLDIGGKALPLEPIAGSERGSGGIVARIGDPRKLGDVSIRLGFNGAEALRIAPVGRVSEVSLRSDWPHPSFDGAFLPDEREVSDSGFTAHWRIPHLARPIPQVSREDQTPRAMGETFGLRFFQPNDFYRKAFRAAQYGILFIALTFLTVLLIENRQGRPAHPVQYVLIGLAEAVFVLLMVAYAEQIGFLPAYLLSAGATIGLISLYGYIGMNLGRRTPVLTALLIVLYAVLYLILESTDYALLAGATLSFAAVALTMVLTRNEDWYGAARARVPVPAVPERGADDASA